MELEKRIELYLKRTGAPTTRIGRLAINDPHFVFELRRGRVVRETTAARVHDWLDRQEAGVGAREGSAAPRR